MGYGPRHANYLREGYAVGTVSASGDWFTVWSSAHVFNLLFPTAEAAQPRLDWLLQYVKGDAAARISVRKVRRAEGRSAFRLLD
ncbi:hypothetical protein [Nocardia tengchongensis]|uniref:hypothetical protein n=1 Tax=Nocardia tengchongensis TaxID=2055889 RepID=UPI003667A4B0